MAVKLSTIGLMLTCATVLIASGMASPVLAGSSDFADIWTEGLEGPRQEELSTERLAELVKYVAKDDAERSKQLNDLYEKERDKFWSEVRDFFRKEREARGDSEGGPGGPGGGPGGPPPNRGRWREQLQKRHDELVEWLKENFPQVEKDLAKVRDKDGDQYAKDFAEIRRIYEPIMSTQGRNPELGGVLIEERQLTIYRDSLLIEIRRAGKDEKRKERLVNELTKVVEQHFDLIVRKKQLQFEELRERLEQLQRELSVREKELGELVKSKDEATKGRVKALLDPKANVDWK